HFENRNFDFSLSGDGVSNLAVSTSSANDSQTKVELRGFDDKYEQDCPRTAATIAQRIIEHCLTYLMSPNCPKLFLRDEDEQEEIGLNALYQREIETQSKRSTAKCCGIDLSINHVRTFAGEFSQHTIHLCANGRDVQHIA